MRAVLIAGGFFIALIVFVLLAELRSEMTVVAGRGGLWLHYTSGLWSCCLVGVQLRWMMGRGPRMWLEFPWMRFPIHIPFRATRKGLRGRRGKLESVNIPWHAVMDLAREFCVRRFDFQLKLGVADNAAATALLCAGALSAVQGARSALARRGETPEGCVRVQPVFTGGALQLRFACILAVKARHIIWELIKAYAAGRKQYGNTSD